MEWNMLYKAKKFKKNLAGFSCIVGEKNSIPIKSFKSFQDLCNQTKEKKLEIFDSLVERVNIFDIKINDKILATQSIKEYLQENEIYSEDDLSFDEGTFLIWLNEMKKNMKKNKRQTI